MTEQTLEQFWVSVVDSLYNDLKRRFVLIRISQAKNGNVYLRIKKREAELLVKKH